MDTTSFSKEQSFPSGLKTAALETISLNALEKASTSEGARLFDASRQYGFFYLNLEATSTGEELLEVVGKLFPLSKEVFEMPQEEKQQYDLKDKGVFFGYKAVGATVIDRHGTLDRMEAWNLGKDDIMQTGPENPNPALIISHRSLIQQYIRLSHRVCDEIFLALEKQLGLQRGALMDLHNLSAHSGDHVRFLKCPSQLNEDRQTAVGEHTDFGSITVLFNRLAGLRIVEPGVTNAWEDWPWVPPKSNHAIINLGDAMVKLTNGLFRSNVHRVDPPPSEQASAARFSLVYFSRPRDDVLLKRVRGSELVPALGEDVVEEEITSKDWILRRAMGKRVGNFKGEDHWDQMQGTEAIMKDGVAGSGLGSGAGPAEANETVAIAVANEETEAMPVPLQPRMMAV